MKQLLVILLIFPLGLFSQYKRVAFLETGSSVNQSFQPKQTLSGEEYSYYPHFIMTCIPIYYQTTSKIHRISTASFYAKIGIERNIIERKHFSFSFPLVFGYKEYKENIQIEATQYPDYRSPENYSLSYKSDHKMAGLTCGPKVIMKFNKWSYFTNLNMNMDFGFYLKYSYINSSEYGHQQTKGEGKHYSDPLFTLSLQNGLLYNVTENIGIGLTNDVFFYNVEAAFYNEKENRKYNHLFNLGYGTNSTTINTGIRLQYSF